VLPVLVLVLAALALVGLLQRRALLLGFLAATALFFPILPFATLVRLAFAVLGGGRGRGREIGLVAILARPLAVASAVATFVTMALLAKRDLALDAVLFIQTHMLGDALSQTERL